MKYVNIVTIIALSIALLAGSLIQKKNREIAEDQIDSLVSIIGRQADALEHLKINREMMRQERDYLLFVKDSLDSIISNTVKIRDGLYYNIASDDECERFKTLTGVYQTRDKICGIEIVSTKVWHKGEIVYHFSAQTEDDEEPWQFLGRSQQAYFVRHVTDSIARKHKLLADSIHRFVSTVPQAK